MEFDLLKIKSDELTLEIQGGEITSSRRKSLEKTGARVFEKNSIQSASFVGQISDQELITRAQGATDTAIPYNYNLPKASSSKTELPQSGLRPQELFHLTQESLEKLKKLAPQFIFSGQCHQIKIEETLSSSFGLDHTISYEEIVTSLMYRHKDSASIVDGDIIGHGLAKFPMEETIQEALPFLQVYENELELKNGRYPVIFPFPEDQLLGKLSESLRADRYFEQTALYSGRMGEKLFHSDFSLWDMNYAPEWLILGPFDGEGVVRSESKLPLIEHGEFKNVVSDLQNAHRYKLQSTGNGLRSFDSAARLGFNKLVLSRGRKSLFELCKELGDCIYVDLAAGGAFTDAGDFSSPVQLSYLIRNGEVIGRLPQLTVNSKLPDMFGADFLGTTRDSKHPSAANPYTLCQMSVLVH